MCFDVGNTSAITVVLHSGDAYTPKDATSRKTFNINTGGSEILNEIDDSVYYYGDDIEAVTELEHEYEYETTDKAHSDVTYSNLSAIPEHENADYDQVGVIYHTLENQEARKEQATHGTYVDPQTKVHYNVTIYHCDERVCCI